MLNACGRKRLLQITGVNVSTHSHELTVDALPGVSVKSTPWSGPRLALFLLAILIIASFMACGDRDLRRDQALKILNDHESQVLVPGGADDPAVVTEPIDVPFVAANPPELAGTEPLRMDDLATYANVLKKPGTIGPITTSIAVALYREQLFLEALRKSGIIRRTGLRNTTTNLAGC